MVPEDSHGHEAAEMPRVPSEVETVTILGIDLRDVLGLLFGLGLLALAWWYPSFGLAW